MNLNNIKSIALTTVLVASAALATFIQTGDSAAQPAVTSADTSCARSAQAWAQSAGYPMAEVAVGASVHSVDELFAAKVATGTRHELVTKVAAIYLNMDSNDVPVDVLEAGFALDTWLVETQLTKRNATPVPAAALATVDGYLGSLASCQG